MSFLCKLLASVDCLWTFDFYQIYTGLGYYLVKKTFLFDCDGVVYDLVAFLLQILTDEGYKNLPSYAQITDANYDFFKKDVILPENARLRAIELMNSRGFAATIPVIKKSQEGIAKIKEKGHSVYWVSSPWWASETWDYDRRAALYRDFQDGYNKVAMMKPKFLVHGDYLFEDTAINADEWANANPSGLALIYDQPWNQKSLKPRFTWDQIDSFLDKIK